MEDVLGKAATPSEIFSLSFANPFPLSFKHELKGSDEGPLKGKPVGHASPEEIALMSSISIIKKKQ